MKSSPRLLTIGELASRLGVRTSVLRHWDAAGVLCPAARVSGRRRYTDDDVYRAKAILTCQEAGLLLDEIRRLLSTRGAKARRSMLARKRSELEARAATIRTAIGIVTEVMYCDATDPVACPRFRAAIAARVSRQR